MESVPSGDTWKVPWDVPAKNRSWFPWREDKIKLVSFGGSSLAAQGKAELAAGFNNFNNLRCIWIGNLGGLKFPLKSLVTLVLVNQSNWRRSSQSEMYILNKHNDCLAAASHYSPWGHRVWTLDIWMCEVRGNYLTQPTQKNLNVPPTFRYQHQPPRDFPFLIGTKAQTNLDDCSRPLDVSQGRAGPPREILWLGARINIGLSLQKATLVVALGVICIVEKINVFLD